VTPREWFETKGSKPELREPPKRRHFATITKAAETCPFQPCAASIYQQQKNAGFQRVSFKTLWARVGGEPTVLNLKILKALKGSLPHPAVHLPAIKALSEH
jgi:hypothetical protein